MKFKALVNLLPILAVALVMAIIWQQSQTSQAARRPGYDDPDAAPPVPGQLPRPESEPAAVINVHDGDTLTVQLGWQKVKVRLCGIDAPELDQPFGVQSRDNLRSLLASAGNQVVLYISDTDRYGRKVAELYVPAHNPQQPEAEKLLNDEQLLAGMASVYTQYASRCPNESGFAKLEAVAKQERRGVWSEPNAVKPWDWRQQRRP